MPEKQDSLPVMIFVPQTYQVLLCYARKFDRTGLQLHTTVLLLGIVERHLGTGTRHFRNHEENPMSAIVAPTFRPMGSIQSKTCFEHE
jgi:hypothetical protein